MLSRYLLRICVFLVFLALIGTPLFYFKRGVYPYTLSKMAFFQIVVEALLFFWIWLVLTQKRYRPRLTPATLGMAVFLALLVLTGILGEDLWRSLWSTQERALGIVTFLHLGMFGFVVASLMKEIPVRRLLYTSLGASVLVCLIALVQLKISNLLLNEPVGNRPGSTFGNPTFLAGYLLFQVCLALYFLIEHLTDASRIRPGGKRPGIFFGFAFPLTALVLGGVTIFITQTRGDILGLGTALFVLLLLFAFRPPAAPSGSAWRSRPIYAGFLVFIAVAGATFWFTRSSNVWSVVPGINRFRTISLQSEEFLPRLIALRAGWKGLGERPLAGWGWDNYNIVFNKHYDPRALRVNYQETRFDKPHNTLLEYFVVGGVPLGAAYLSLLGILVFEALKLKDRLFGQIAVAALAGYFVRNLFVFETIGPLLMAFLVFGVVDGSYRERRALPVRPDDAGRSDGPPDSSQNNKPKVSVGRWVLLSGIAALTLVFAYFANIGTLRASYHQFWGFTNFVNARTDAALASFKKAIGVWNPYRWSLKRDYAAAVAEAYFYNPGVVPEEEAWAALRAMEEVAREHPHDAYNHYALVDMYNQASDLNPEKLLAAAEREGAIALQLTPQRQEVYFSLAKTKSLRGDYDGARVLLDEALRLEPNVPDAHFYYGLIAFAQGDAEVGYREIREARSLGRGWKNFYEPRVVANYFAEGGYLTEAIDLYRESSAMRPDDLETKVKLGIAYFLAGQHDLARKHLREVGEKVDLRQSPQYNELKAIYEALDLRIK